MLHFIRIVNSAHGPFAASVLTHVLFHPLGNIYSKDYFKINREIIKPYELC